MSGLKQYRRLQQIVSRITMLNLQHQCDKDRKPEIDTKRAAECLPKFIC
jgi:hypothetical protein